MVERTKEHYENSFTQAREEISAFASNIAMGTYDKAISIDQIGVLKETINKQRTDIADANEKYRELYNCPEHTAYKEFVEKSLEVIEELNHIPVIQADNKLEEILED